MKASSKPLKEKSFLQQAPKRSAVLDEHNKRFKKRIEKVTDGIYVAVGYALGNSALIETNEGNIIIDTTENFKAAEEIHAEFQRISPKRTAAVIYTHGHQDHVVGTHAFIDEKTEIYAHRGIEAILESEQNQTAESIWSKASRMYGELLPDNWKSCTGLGTLHTSIDYGNKPVARPTQVYEDTMELTIGGLKLVLIHVPGETDDHTAVWLPEKKVLFPGDDYYPCFPNLYTIRGTTYRPVAGWFQSIDKMRDLHPEYMVPSHAEPIIGREKISELLTAYRDAIQYVHDAVIRGANNDKTIDEMVREIELPTHLREHPALKEVYGKVSWSVKAIFQGNLGWFDGNPTNLHPLSLKEKSKKISDLIGGDEKLLEEAERALERQEYQWACELSDFILAKDKHHNRAVKIKAEALFRMGEQEDNPNARCYYLQSALELNGDREPLNPYELRLRFIQSVPIEKFIDKMSILLNPETSSNVVLSACVHITDTNKDYRIFVRRGVAEIREGRIDNPDIDVRSNADVWKEVVLGTVDLKESMIEERIQVKTGSDQLPEFLSLFRP